ncbi:MAG: GRAM domain-containing protein [Bacteroidota bacterium]
MFNIQVELIENENIELSQGANHFKGLEGVGGKLFITNKRIVFKSHSINLQNHELTIMYPEILSIELYNTLGIVPNGLKIITKSGKNEKFVVWKRKIIKKIIEGKIACI